MTEKHYGEIFSIIENEIKSVGLEVKIIENPDGKLLRTAIPCGSSEEFTALADMALVTLGSGTELAQIYFTLTAELSEEASAELNKAFPTLNFYSIIGSYGIFNSSQVYFKYAVALSEADDAELHASEVLDAYAVAHESLCTAYDVVMAMASGALTYADAVKNELLPEM